MPVKQRLQGKLTAIVKEKCTPQPEHIAEAVYLHHKKHIKNIHAVEYIGEAATRHVMGQPDLQTSQTAKKQRRSIRQPPTSPRNLCQRGP